MAKKKIAVYIDSPETIEMAKKLGLQTAGGQEFRPTKEVFESEGVETVKPKEPSLGFKAKWAIEREAPKLAKSAKGFLSWVGQEAKVVGGKIQEGLHEYSIKKQAEVAAREAAEKKGVPVIATPKVEIPSEKECPPCPETEPAEAEDIREPPVQVLYRPKAKRSFALHKEGDLVTLPKEDLNKILLEAVKHGKLHRGNVRVKFTEKALKPPKLKPFSWLRSPK